MKTSKSVSSSRKSIFIVTIVVAVFLPLSFASAEVVNFVYTADKMPQEDGWTLQNYPAYEEGHVWLDPVGILHMNDPETYNGSACQYYKHYTESSAPRVSIAAEWDVMVVSSNNGSHFWIDDGVSYFGFDIMADSVRSWRTSHQVNAVTTDDYHTYRVELESGQFRLFQDGNLLFEGDATDSCSPGEVMVGFGLGSSWGTAEFYLDEVRAYEMLLAVDIDIDIKPGSDLNAINLGSNGLIPVAILSSEDFDATTVDPDTVELAGSGVAVRGKSNKYMAHEEDVNEDGLVDLVLQVATANLDPDSFQDGVAVLTGQTYGGEAIEGSNEITIVPNG